MSVEMEIKTIKGKTCIKCTGYNDHHYYYFDSLKKAKDILFLFERDQMRIKSMISRRKRLRERLSAWTNLSMDGEWEWLSKKIHIIDESIKLIEGKKYV